MTKGKEVMEMFVYLYHKMNKTQQKVTIATTVTLLVAGIALLFV